MRTKQFRLFFCFFCCLSLMAGCAKPVQVKHIAAQEAIKVSSSDEAKPILFKKIAVKMPRGTRVGSVRQGFFCEIYLADLTWQGGTINLPEGAFNEVFRQELEKASNLTSATRQNRAKFRAYLQFCRGLDHHQLINSKENIEVSQETAMIL
jgi:hypothetical protein